ncbi:uncharacterized protein [Physcomitrium patens]|uniref:Uncharacterized protein n=1 Tax=Physcomitrium patens TaxID=3218 RepID=A0A2K1JTL8_PHYPA|nr:uncharacterized protein LOC112288557 [Physcomitrium patens]PNR44846.1 hypothetical protein PHYPA_014616 [Physcomitrium patens]|eukprot:XP_024388605.1 uncharacterized protein LOC112288557 [Physcomitrella patens]
MGMEAVCSSKFFASNAVTAPTLSYHISIDLDFKDGSFLRRAKRSTKMAASEGTGPQFRIVRRTNNVLGSAASFGCGFTPPLTSTERSEPCICRANSSERSGLPERDDEEKQPDAETQQVKRQGSYTVGLSFGSSNPEADGFQRSPASDDRDEFFAKLSMALEASRLADSRASSISTTAFSEIPGDGSSLVVGRDIQGPSSVSSLVISTIPSTSGTNLCGLGVGGMQLPPSIKKLKRPPRLSRPARGSSQCAIKRAFSSVVYMIKVVQSHALQIRQALFSERDVQEVLHVVHQEMHSSFVWLFQQVFACTPKLMVSVMILLANFTVFSTGESVTAIAAATETPAAIASFLSTNRDTPQTVSSLLSSSSDSKMSFGSQGYLIPGLVQDSPLFPLAGAGSGGNNKSPTVPTAESFDGDDGWQNNITTDQGYMLSKKDSTVPLELSHITGPAIKPAHQFQVEPEHGNYDSVEQTNKNGHSRSHPELMKASVESSMKDIILANDYVQLEQDTIRRLVAPLVAHLESDNYACFDRTDLEYQHALTQEPSRPLLLANYAQFLFVVRRDYDRAEEYFHRAVLADPLDSTILARFASFLWLGRGNRSAAERAYKAAIAADPQSSYPAGSYAHFLWHAGDGDNSETMAM